MRFIKVYFVLLNILSQTETAGKGVASHKLVKYPAVSANGVPACAELILCKSLSGCRSLKRLRLCADQVIKITAQNIHNVIF